jgi:hypothetical protein
MEKKTYANGDSGDQLTGGRSYNQPDGSPELSVRVGEVVDAATSDNEETKVQLRRGKESVFCSRRNRRQERTPSETMVAMKARREKRLARMPMTR